MPSTTTTQAPAASAVNRRRSSERHAAGAAGVERRPRSDEAISRASLATSGASDQRRGGRRVSDIGYTPDRPSADVHSTTAAAAAASCRADLDNGRLDSRSTTGHVLFVFLSFSIFFFSYNFLKDRSTRHIIYDSVSPIASLHCPTPLNLTVALCRDGRCELTITDTKSVSSFYSTGLDVEHSTSCSVPLADAWIEQSVASVGLSVCVCVSVYACLRSQMK